MADEIFSSIHIECRIYRELLIEVRGRCDVLIFMECKISENSLIIMRILQGNANTSKFRQSES